MGIENQELLEEIEYIANEYVKEGWIYNDAYVLGDQFNDTLYYAKELSKDYDVDIELIHEALEDKIYELYLNIS